MPKSIDFKGIFFTFYENHFKLANWLHTRTAPFSAIQLNSNILCRVFIHSNTISKIMLALLRFYVPISYRQFSNFQSRFSIRCNKYFIEFLKAIHSFSSNYIVCSLFFYYNAQSLNGKKDAFCLLSFNLRSLILKFVVVI